VAFGGGDTKRDSGFAKVVTTIFESVGLLNKGSANAVAAPSPSEADQVQPVSSNALNVTRVGGVATLIGGVGAAALAIFSVDKAHDRTEIVVAAYASVGVIVASALITVAIIIAADIRARAAIAVTTSASSSQKPVDVKLVQGSAETKMALDHPYEYVLVDAGSGTVDLTLPKAASSAWQCLIVKRTDTNEAHDVRVEPLPAGEASLRPGQRIRVYSDGVSWIKL
jgi:hypothetical protein